MERSQRSHLSGMFNMERSSDQIKQDEKGDGRMSVGATLLVLIFIGGYFVWKCIND